jgi:hypothetical protein
MKIINRNFMCLIILKNISHERSSRQSRVPAENLEIEGSPYLPVRHHAKIKKQKIRNHPEAGHWLNDTSKLLHSCSAA